MKFAIAALALACSTTLACAGTASDSTVGPQGPQGPAGPSAPSDTSTSTAPTSGGRITIKRTRYIGADGSATTPFENSYHDEMLNTECAIETAADGVMRCIPSGGAVIIGYFTDAGCTTPVAVLTGVAPCSPAPYVVQFASPQACNGATSAHVLSVGAQLSTTAAIYVGTPGNCFATTQSPSFRYFTTGAEVPASNFVAFTKETL